MVSVQKLGDIAAYQGDTLDCYPLWDTPHTIVSDGAYGVGGFPGDPKSPDKLADWYRPHVKAWTEAAQPYTALWLWNTEVGFANVHPVLVEHGWQYVQMCVWDKGVGHVAGNVNSATIRRFPQVTEVAVLYQRKPVFTIDGSGGSLQDYLRSEWKRAGLTLNQANIACGVKSAASRKYLAKDHLFYAPPTPMMQRLVDYAQANGKPLAGGEPGYFEEVDTLLRKNAWESIRYHWNHVHGLTNVWSEPTLRGGERLKVAGKNVHLNQKPLSLASRVVNATTPPNGIIWEPFGGLGSFSVAARETGRKAFYAESNPLFYQAAVDRFTTL